MRNFDQNRWPTDLAAAAARHAAMQLHYFWRDSQQQRSTASLLTPISSLHHMHVHVQGVSAEELISSLGSSAGPQSNATEAEYVKFHDDKVRRLGSCILCEKLKFPLLQFPFQHAFQDEVHNIGGGAGNLAAGPETWHTLALR